MDDPREGVRTAERLMQAGDWAASIDAFRRVLAAHPDLPDAWYNLGYLLRHARDYRGALDAYGEALARRVRGPEEVHINRAAIYSEALNRPEAAEAELKAAVAANPRAALAWLNLGLLAEDRGDAGAARDAYGRVVALEPGNGRALARLAALDAMGGDPAAVAARLEARLAQGGLHPDAAADLWFALGAARDAAGQYPAAFAAIAEGNRIAKSLLPPAYRYQPKAQEGLVDALRALPRPDPAECAPPAGAATPLFICGMFRSGSTLAEQLIARHAAGVTAGGELEFIPALVATELQPYPARLASLSADSATRLQARYLDELAQVAPGAGRVTDKRCDNVMHIGLIKRLFPEAKIVHTMRNPLDTILSVYFLRFADTIGYGFDLADIAHYFAQYSRIVAHWKSLWPEDIVDLDYDALVAGPEPVLDAAFGALGLSWGNRGFGAPPRENVRTASAWQVRQPVHPRSSGRWRNYAAQLEDVREALAAARVL